MLHSGVRGDSRRPLHRLENKPGLESLRSAGNDEFFAHVAKELDKAKHNRRAAIVLVGRTSLAGYLLRQAQSFQRWDRLPSYWSHAFLLVDELPLEAKAVPSTRLWECTIEPESPSDWHPERNGVSVANLARYVDRELNPNVAVIAFNLKPDVVAKVVAQAGEVNLDRKRFDFWKLLGEWHHYLWSSSEMPNPLTQGHRLPSSGYVEFSYEAVPLDVTPGASERDSSPEQIWQGALWWYRQYADRGHPVVTYTMVRDEFPSVLQPLPQRMAPPEWVQKELAKTRVPEPKVSRQRRRPKLR